MSNIKIIFRHTKFANNKNCEVFFLNKALSLPRIIFHVCWHRKELFYFKNST
jgi:hypothetical protein